MKRFGNLPFGALAGVSHAGNDFGFAMGAMWDGASVARQDWHNGVVVGIDISGSGVFSGPVMMSFAPNGERQPWTPNNADLVARDWVSV